MFYISEDELRFKKDTTPEYYNETLAYVFMNEMFILERRFKIQNFKEHMKRAMQFFLNRTYVNNVVVFFEDGSVLKAEFLDDGFDCKEHKDNQISTAFYYDRYSMRVFF